LPLPRMLTSSSHVCTILHMLLLIVVLDQLLRC
jgi:hypothetical protein